MTVLLFSHAKPAKSPPRRSEAWSVDRRDSEFKLEFSLFPCQPRGRRAGAGVPPRAQGQERQAVRDSNSQPVAAPSANETEGSKQSRQQHATHLLARPCSRHTKADQAQGKASNPMSLWLITGIVLKAGRVGGTRLGSGENSVRLLARIGREWVPRVSMTREIPPRILGGGPVDSTGARVDDQQGWCQGLNRQQGRRESIPRRPARRRMGAMSRA